MGDPVTDFRKRVNESRDNVRAKAIIEGISQGKSPQQAAKDLGLPPEVVKRAHKLVEGTELRRKMQGAMIRQGGRLDRIAETVVGAMDATVYVTTGDGVKSTDVADHKTRIGAAKLAAELMGVTRADAREGMAMQVVINIPASAQAWLDKD